MVLAVPTPPVRAAGLRLTSAIYGSDVTDNVNFLTNPPFAVLTVTTPQSGPASSAAVNAALQFDTEVTDTYGAHSTVTNNSRYTAVAAGWYAVRSAVCWTPNATGNRVMALYVNGVVVPYAQTQQPASTATNFTITEINSHVLMAAGDYLETWVGQNSGGALAIVAAGTTMQVRFSHAGLL